MPSAALEAYLDVFNAAFAEVKMLEVDVGREIGALDCRRLKDISVQIQLQRVPAKHRKCARCTCQAGMYGRVAPSPDVKSVAKNGRSFR